MTDIFTCVEDDVAPEDIKKAGESGMLQVKTILGWFDISQEDFTGVLNSCEYRIKGVKVFLEQDEVNLIYSLMRDYRDPIPKDLCPTLYKTGTYSGDVILKERADILAKKLDKQR